jgi:hypothetical protein
MKYRINISDFTDDEILVASDLSDGYPYVSLTNRNLVIQGKRKTLVGLSGFLEGYCQSISNKDLSFEESPCFEVNHLLSEIKKNLKQIAQAQKLNKEI